jgi:hypothetical protein
MPKMMEMVLHTHAMIMLCSLMAWNMPPENTSDRSRVELVTFAFLAMRYVWSIEMHTAILPSSALTSQDGAAQETPPVYMRRRRSESALRSPSTQ